MTAIEWTDETWNPVVGCSLVSPGCTNCYAMKWAAARMDGNPKSPHYTGTTKTVNGNAVWASKIGIAPDHIWTKPLRWKRPRRIFVNSMGDLFHEAIPDEVIARAFAVMALAPQHTFQILTKRPERMREYLAGSYFKSRLIGALAEIERTTPPGESGTDPNTRTGWDARSARQNLEDGLGRPHLPLPNVWLGVSAEDQTRADERIPLLLDIQAAVRFISAEPLLGPVDLTRVIFYDITINALNGRYASATGDGKCPRLDWVIVGGESGPGSRPMHPAWARSLRDQCAAASVPFFFKQWGDWKEGSDFKPDAEIVTYGGKRYRTHEEFRAAAIRDGSGNYAEMMRLVGKRLAGRHLDGLTYDEMPSRNGGDQ